MMNFKKIIAELITEIPIFAAIVILVGFQEIAVEVFSVSFTATGVNTSDVLPEIYITLYVVLLSLIVLPLVFTSVMEVVK